MGRRLGRFRHAEENVLERGVPTGSGARPELRKRSVGEDTSLLDDRNACRELFDEREAVGTYERGATPDLPAPQPILQNPLGLRIQPDEWFVEYNERRVAEHRHREVNLLALTLRKLGTQLGLLVCEIELGEEALRTYFPAGREFVRSG